MKGLGAASIFAMRLQDPGLEHLKTDPLFDPVRQEPRFQAAMRALKSPN